MKKLERYITWKSYPGGKRVVRVLRLFSYRGIRLMLHRVPPEIDWCGKYGVSHEPSGSNVERGETPFQAIEAAKARLDECRKRTLKAAREHVRINRNARRDDLVQIRKFARS